MPPGHMRSGSASEYDRPPSGWPSSPVSHTAKSFGVPSGARPRTATCRRQSSRMLSCPTNCSNCPSDERITLSACHVAVPRSQHRVASSGGKVLPAGVGKQCAIHRAPECDGYPGGRGLRCYITVSKQLCHISNLFGGWVRKCTSGGCSSVQHIQGQTSTVTASGVVNSGHLFGALGAEVDERQLQLGARQHHRRQREPRVRRGALRVEAWRHPRGDHRRQRRRYVRHDGCAQGLHPSAV
jgi:hypothetical protein